jgi:predicted molibdopterin-dependent oxidoreductase YjgC
LREIQRQHGPGAAAFLSSPRCSNEESYLLQKLARAVIGTNNVDHGTGVYCNNSIHTLLEMIGVPATTNSIGELASSGVIVVDGVDLARQLPTIGGIVLRARLSGAKLVVVDSRRHRLAENADYFLQVNPGTEPALYGAMAKVIVDRGLMNLPFIKRHCASYEEFLAGVYEYDLAEVAGECGVPGELIEASALAYAQARSASILYSTGIESRDRSAVEAIVNLALLTGQIGREGAGIYALTEQNNLQGVCDMGMLPDQLPGYRPVADARSRSELEAKWGGTLPSRPGREARSILTDRADGTVRALWLCRYDPVSTAFFGDAAATLDACELVVVQHLFLTETARHAHVILPTTAFGEEQVTFTSTDRRIQLAEKVIEPQPGVIPAWMQLARVASALGVDWNYRSASDVMDEIRSVVPFYSGASYHNLSAQYGRQWPCTEERPLGTRFIPLEDFPKSRLRFAPVARPRRQVPLEDYPLHLVFGHSHYYWHQNVLVKHSETLKREYRMLLLDYPDGFVEVNAGDAKRLGIRDGERIRLRSPAGSATVAARVTPEVRGGTVFVPYFVRQVQQQVWGVPANGAHAVPIRIEKEAV